MNELTLKNSGGEETRIIIGPDALEGLGEIASTYTKAVLITDGGAEDQCLERAAASLPDAIEKIVIEGGEDSKNLDVSKKILGELRTAGCDRKSLVIGLGGGVVNDIAGFVASVYMRGIDWVMIPTTLTAQADASIGGKTGVNLGQYKNMVGSFWPSKAVLIDPGFLDTLPKNHLKNGLAEIIKMGFIADKSILAKVKDIDPDSLLGEELLQASRLAVQAKVEIVNRDMYESGERKLLNFGHTVGHAIESLSLDTDKPLLHGEAIAIGMVAEAKLGELEGVTEPGLSAEITRLLERFGLPVSYSGGVEDILEIIVSDKKNVGADIRWTLPKKGGEGTFDYEAEEANIGSAIKSVIGS